MAVRMAHLSGQLKAVRMGRVMAGWMAAHWELKTVETTVAHWDVWTVVWSATYLVGQMVDPRVQL